MQTKDRRGTIKQNSARTALRYQKLRRVQQKTVINCQRAAERCLHPESQTHSIGPMRPQICLIDRRQKISGRHERRVFLAEQIADSPEHVAPVVKRHHLHRPCERNSCFEIYHCERIPTKRDGKRIQKHDVLLRISKRPLRYYYLARTSFFKTESAQCRRTTGEETLADRQRTIDLINGSIAIAVAWIKKICEAQGHVSGQHGVSQR